MREVRIGRFMVNDVCSDEYGLLRAAQEGCAVIRCELLSYNRRYEVYAEHPEFDNIPIDHVVPLYEVETEQVDGVYRRVRFAKAQNQA